MSRCKNCGAELPEGAKFCLECGTKVPLESAGGFSLKMGDANAISGGVNMADSHNVHNEDRSIHNTSNVSNVTHVEAQKSVTQIKEEKLQKGRNRYTDALDRFFANDGVIDSRERRELEKIRSDYELDESWCKREEDRISMEYRGNSLSKVAQYELEDLKKAIKKNNIAEVKEHTTRLTTHIDKSNEDLQFYYHLSLAVTEPKVWLSMDASQSANYWRSFWGYLAYLKLDYVDVDKAREVLASLQNFKSYPEDNETILRTVGEYLFRGKKSATEWLKRVEDDYSPQLQDLMYTLKILLDPKNAEREGLCDVDYAFYIVNVFEQEDPKERIERENREAEKKAKEEAEAKRRAEEAKRRAEEAKRKAEEEARRAKEEAEKKAKEEQERKEREKIEKEKKTLRAKVTYSISITGVRQGQELLGLMGMCLVLRMGANDARAILANLPYKILQTNRKNEASRIAHDLKVADLILDLSAVNGLNESVDFPQY